MSAKVGIPRALLYYEYYPLWKTFFEALDVEVVLSDRTNKAILNDGVKSCVDEACLPVKLYHGHILNLKDRVDYLFIPRLKSVAKNEYICPKFCGLPEMIKYTIKDLPPIIDIEVNLRKSQHPLYSAFRAVGQMFTNDSYLIQYAYHKALQAQQNYRKMLAEGKYPSEILDGKNLQHVGRANLCIALVGHVYNLYDDYVSMNIISKLQHENIKVITPECLDSKEVQYQADGLYKKLFWTYGKRLAGSVLHLMKKNDVDGILYIMSFGCGIDAFVADLCERNIRRATNIPFSILTLDEQSGEAGINTRLEAFIDLIRWRKKDEGYIPAHG